MGSGSEYFGLVLESCRYPFRTVLALFWNCFDGVLELSWHWFGIVLASLLNCVGIALELFKVCFEIVLVLLWNYFGIVFHEVPVRNQVDCPAHRR